MEQRPIAAVQNAITSINSADAKRPEETAPAFLQPADDAVRDRDLGFRPWDVTACSNSGNVMVLSGDREDGLTVGRTVRLAGKLVGRLGDGEHFVSIDATGDDNAGKDNSSLTLWITPKGPPIHPGAYQSYSSRSGYGETAIRISFSTTGCDTTDSVMKVHDIQWKGGQLLRFIATFEQYCVARAGAVRGCVHFDDAAREDFSRAPTKKHAPDLSY